MDIAVSEEVVVEPPSKPDRKDWFVSVTTLLAGAAIIAYLTWFNNYAPIGEYYLVVNTTCLFFLPFLLIFTVFRERAEEFGFRPPENRAGRIGLIFLGAMVPLLLVALLYPPLAKPFQAYYPMRPEAASNWHFLFYWEVTYGFYMFCWEFFYRGFLTFGLKRAFGPVAAVVLQTVGFGLMHYHKPTLEFASSFIGGAALGWLALRGKSFYPCFAVHWAISIIVDLLAIHAKGTLF